MGENFLSPTYLILLLITITRLISTVGKTEQWKSLLPPEISNKLREDPEAIQGASRDYGNHIHDVPAGVFVPSSVQDIATLIKLSYNNNKVGDSVPFSIAARGQGHSTKGQAMARDGVVVDMARFREGGNGVGITVGGGGGKQYYADVGGEQLWIDVLRAAMEHGLTPVSWTDYLYLTVGGTLSNAGISGQTFKYGPQITSVLEMDVITGTKFN